MRAALLLCLVALEVSAQGRIYDRTRAVSSRRSSRGGVACGVAPFSLFASYSFTAGGAVPALSETGLVALCTPNATATAWQCVDSAGAAVGTVSQGTGTTYVGSFAPGVTAINDLTVATAPRVTGAAFDALLGGDITVVVGGYVTTQTDATFQNLIGLINTGDFANVLGARVNSGNLDCNFIESGAATATASTSAVVPQDGWSVSSCRRTGNNRIARVNGSDGATNSTAGTRAVTSGLTVFFGTDQTPALPMRGPLAFVAFYNVGKTAAEMKAIESRFWGITSEEVAPLGQLVGADNVADSGFVDMMHPSATIVHPSLGVQTIRGFTPSWAADALDVSSWTDVGTPTVSTNVASGPFSRWKNTAEVDRIVDDAAGALEGKQSTGSAGSTVGYYTAACYLAAGDTGTVKTKARLVVTTDGTGSTNCDFADLGATHVRKTCTAAITGSPTYVKGQVLVGNADADTGSVLVAQCSLNPKAWAEAPTVTNAAIGNVVSTGIDTTGWPNPSTGGKYEYVFTPRDTGNAPTWQSGDDTLYLFDAIEATPNHSVTSVWGYTSAGNALALTSNTGGSTFLETPGVTLVAGTTYVTSVEWRPASGGKCNIVHRLDACVGGAAACHATTAIGSQSAGECPAVPVNLALGERYTGSAFPTSAWFGAVRIYSLP